MLKIGQGVLRAVAMGGSVAIGMPSVAGLDSFADAFISYDPGTSAPALYTNALTALGSPERISGEFFGESDVVSGFSPPYGPDEIVAIGPAGHLIVQFDEPVTNDPNNLFGIDLLIFGNAFFIDQAPQNGIVGGFFGNTLGTIEVSVDSETWETVPTLFANSLFPTYGFVDCGPYAHEAGRIPTDFTRPVDPTLTIDHLINLDNAQVIELYRGAGGGVGVDLAAVNLDAIHYVRISVPTDAVTYVVIDAFADVEARLPGDVDLNGVVDVDDLLAIINGWGAVEPGDPPADFTGDGTVDVDDLLVVINHWSA